MVMSFFRRSSTGLEHVESQAVTMLGDARHSFDLANAALLDDARSEATAVEIRRIDHRINQAEQDLRAELVVHISVQGGKEIASVLGFILVLKKIERIGDQAKNILDLAQEGVSLSGAEDIAVLRTEQREVSSLFGRAGELLVDPDLDRARRFVTQVGDLLAVHRAKVDADMFSDRPGREVVPRAIYYRYLKRIVANLRGIVAVAFDPLTPVDHLTETAGSTGRNRRSAADDHDDDGAPLGEQKCGQHGDGPERDRTVTEP
jgi:uncharacterized protein with PhoU and TrkA domain